MLDFEEIKRRVIYAANENSVTELSVLTNELLVWTSDIISDIQECCNEEVQMKFTDELV